MRTIFPSLEAAAALTIAAPAAAAVPITCTDNATFLAGCTTNSPQTIGSDGVDFFTTYDGSPFGVLSFDFNSQGLLITALTNNINAGVPVTGNFTFTPLTSFTRASFLGTSNVFGGAGVTNFSASNFSVAPDGYLVLNFTGLTFGTYTQVQLGLSQAAPVPEPRTWVMMILGFGAIGLSMRGREQSRADAPMKV